MKILFPIAECEPFAKTGGLGDVGGALPVELFKKNIDIRVIMPFYQKVKTFFKENSDFKLFTVIKDLEVKFENYPHAIKKIYSFDVYQSHLANNSDVPIYFIDIPEFFDRPNLYVDEFGKGFPDSANIFTYFTKALFTFLDSFGWYPEIIHSHDWHMGLIPLFIKHSLIKVKNKINTVFTIHNIAYQGIFPIETAENFDFISNDLIMKDLEFFKKINFLKAGILSTNIVTTVSENYRDELLTKEYGFGLEDYLQEKKNSFYGILNGVDYSSWNPQTDKFIISTYSAENLEGKKSCKSFLWSLVKSHDPNFTLEEPKIPIFGMVARLDVQKGVDLIIEAIPELVKEKMHIIMVGSGNKKFESKLEELGSKYSYFTFIKGFSNNLAHQVEAGSDFFLMPSKFEPCGLNQMYSLKYGTFPIVRKTGGLADTVIDISDQENGNGFLFNEFTSEDLIESIKRAIRFYFNSNDLEINSLRSKIMNLEFSWNKSVEKYISIYKNLLMG